MTFSCNLASLEPSTCKSTQLTVFSCCQMPLGVIWNSISNFHLSFWCWSSTFRSGEALAGVVPTVFFHCTHHPSGSIYVFSPPRSKGLSLHSWSMGFRALVKQPKSICWTLCWRGLRKVFIRSGLVTKWPVSMLLGFRLLISISH